MKTVGYVVGALAAVALVFLYFSKNKKALYDGTGIISGGVDPLVDNSDNGRTDISTDTNLTGLGTGSNASSPSQVLFVDFAAMRFLGNNGKTFGNGGTGSSRGGQRAITDPLYNTTGFVVREGVDLSRFKIGTPVRINASSTNTNPHFTEGIMEIKALIPAIPGHSTEVRGTWVVTNSTWRTGSTSNESGLLQIL
jgi:hypothetical protein